MKILTTTLILLTTQTQTMIVALNVNTSPSRRAFLTQSSSSAAAAWCASLGLVTTTVALPEEAQAVGPVKVPLEVISYSAKVCPPSKPIPGEKAMKGMRGLCVTVKARITEASPKDLEKVGVYGFVTDAISGDSVLANNPDLSTDAGQFSMVENVVPKDREIEFEFVAAIPMEKDISQEENGIGELAFKSLRLVSFPGGQQYGAINPCEMNEFSDECDVWEEENGPYEKGKFMVNSNSRTKGR